MEYKEFRERQGTLRRRPSRYKKHGARNTIARQNRAHFFRAHNNLWGDPAMTRACMDDGPSVDYNHFLPNQPTPLNEQSLAMRHETCR